MVLVKEQPVEQERDYTWRHQHIGRLLFEVQKDFQHRSIRQLRDLGYEDITPAYINVIASVSTQGTRLTDIARDLDITKQAVGKMVRELTEKGYLSRREDPVDGRATLVTFTERGERFLNNAKAGIDDIERLYADLLGAETLSELKGTLEGLLARTREG